MMTILKSQYIEVKDELTTVAAKIPKSLDTLAKQVCKELDITMSVLIKFALGQYLDGIKHADMSLKLELIADGVSNKASEITQQNIKLLESQEEIKALLKTLLDDTSDLDNKIINEVLNIFDGAKS
jgi:antitoxin component of RelBE/YafQ-DinJ toxin-antitoxin module